MKKILVIFILFIEVFGAPAGLFGPRDNRQLLKDKVADDCFSVDYFQGLGKSICIIVPKSAISECHGTGTVILPCQGVNVNLSLFRTFGQYVSQVYGKPVCSTVRFKDEKVINGCGTGFAIADDLVMTASHVIKELGGPDNVVCLFQVLDYSAPMTCSTTPNQNIPSWKYFKVTAMFKDYDPNSNIINRDIAILRLDHCVTTMNIQPLSIIQGDPKSLAIGKEIFTIGHPNGLPLTISDSGIIHSTVTSSAFGFGQTGAPPVDSFKNYFFANLDIMPGNSGSPVFIKDSMQSYKVLGIVIRSPQEFDTSSTGCIQEHWITEAEFKNFPQDRQSTWIQTLNGIQFYPYSTCPSVAYDCGSQIAGCKVKYGMTLCVQIPTNFGSGTTVVKWNGNISTYAAPGSKACIRLANKTPYDVKLWSTTGDYLMSFNLKGEASGSQNLGCQPGTGSTQTTMGAVIQPPPSPIINRTSFTTLNSSVGNMPLFVHFYPFIPTSVWAGLKSLKWDFGDGTTSDEQFPSHKYVQPGTFDVSLVVQYTNAMPGLHSDTSKQLDIVVVSPQVEALNDLGGIIDVGNKSIVVGPTSDEVVNNVGVKTTSGTIDILNGTTIKTTGTGTVTIQSK